MLLPINALRCRFAAESVFLIPSQKSGDTLVKLADTEHFAIFGLSQGGSVAYWYAAYGRRMPDALVVGCTTPDYNSFVDDSCVKNGALADPIWSEEEIAAFIRENNPVNRPERFRRLPILSGNSFDDPMVSYTGSEAFEKSLKELGNENIAFYYFDKAGHNVTEDFMQKVLPFLKKYL